MATILYRDGEQHRVNAKRVSNHLENGYFLTREESLGEESIRDIIEDAIEEIAEEFIEEVTEKIVDKLSDEDVRLIAKELGINNWHNSKIDNLKAKIEAKEHGNSD